MLGEHIQWSTIPLARGLGGSNGIVFIGVEDVVLEFFGHPQREGINTSGDGNVLDVLPVFRS